MHVILLSFYCCVTLTWNLLLWLLHQPQQSPCLLKTNDSVINALINLNHGVSFGHYSPVDSAVLSRFISAVVLFPILSDVLICVFLLSRLISVLFQLWTLLFAVSALDQSGSVGSGQPLVNAIRSDSALIGGTGTGTCLAVFYWYAPSVMSLDGSCVHGTLKFMSCVISPFFFAHFNHTCSFYCLR